MSRPSRTPAAVPGREELIARAAALRPAIAARAGETERLGRIHPDSVAELGAAGLWRVHRPLRYGGYEGGFGLYIEIGEEIGAACASTAWVWVNIISHNWMLGMWPPEGQEAVWGEDPDALIGSSVIYPAGRAERVEGGFRLTGRWPFSSGIDACSWIMLGAMVPPESGDGPPVPRAFTIRARDIEVIDTWDVVGLIGTGSKDVACTDVFVPEHMTLEPRQMRGGPTPGMAVNANPLYRLPMMALFASVIAGPMLGCARGAYELYVDQMRARTATYNARRIAELATMQLRIAEADTLIRAARELLRCTPREAHAFAEAGEMPDDAAKARWRADAAYAVRMCGRAVDLLYEAAGGAANYRRNPLQRHFRDVHAGMGHIGVSWDANGTEHGRAALGLPSENPML